MKRLDSKLLNEFLNEASNSLIGEWVLLGGTLLQAVGIDTRVTVDIDFVGLTQKEYVQNLELMNLAEKLGIAIETINQAAGLYLKKVGYQKKDLLLLKNGKTSKIFRPNLELYFKLKLLRMTDTDLMDCEQYLDYCIKQKDVLSFDQIKTIIKDSILNTDQIEKINRFKKLEKKIKTIAS